MCIETAADKIYTEKKAQPLAYGAYGADDSDAYSDVAE